MPAVLIMDMAHEHEFELTEHTADIGVIASGGTLAEAFESAAYGMFSIVADLDKYRPTSVVTIDTKGDDNISLLGRFLSSLLVIFDGDSLLPLDFEIVQISENILTCRVSVREFGDDIEWIGPAIKAVTYHAISVENQDSKWRVAVIFDV